MVAVVEQTTLPRITAEAKQSEWTGYVNAYVTGRYQTDMANGRWLKDLWYVSYVLPKGQGTVGQAIFNAFVSNTGSKSFAIEGIGSVCLGSQRQDLQSLGYKVHWNYRMEPLGPDAIQCVIEPLMLTSFDPQLAETSNKRARKGAKSGSGKKGNTKSEVTSLTTAPSSSSMEHQEAEITRREQKPMFLLLIPGVRANDTDYLEQLHLAYLRKRCPFDLDAEWASMLWKRAGEKNEVRELSAWSYMYEPKTNPEDFAILSAPSYTPSKDITPVDMPKEESPFQAVISQAFLCLPDIEGIHTSLLNTVVLRREKEEVAA